MKLLCQRRHRPLHKVASKSATSKRVVAAFCQHVARIKYLHNIYIELVEDPKALRLMELQANDFFHRLNDLVIDGLLLEFAKITDPAVSSISGRENFTLSNILETIDWPPEVMSQLRPIVVRSMRFAKKVLPARNRILAHTDKQTILSGQRVGGFPKGEDKQFLRDLEDLCNIIHQETHGIIFGSIGVTCPGDVLDFKKSLRKAHAFDILFERSRGDERIKLMDLFLESPTGRNPLVFRRRLQ